MDFLEALQRRAVIGDGAMGTELLAAGVAAESRLEHLCLSQPDLVRRMHRSYLAAGAQLIETNSFGANAVRLAKHGLANHLSEINWTAAQLAHECAKGTGAHVAGSVGPLGITLGEAQARGIDPEDVFTEQLGALLDGGARVIFLETFTNVNELVIAIRAKHALHHCPVIASLVCDETGHLPDGTALAAAFSTVREAEADVIGVNCVALSPALLATLSTLAQEIPVAAFPHAGIPESREGRLCFPSAPGEFARAGLALAEAGVRLIGGCCGAGPAHIAALAEALQDRLTKSQIAAAS